MRNSEETLETVGRSWEGATENCKAEAGGQMPCFVLFGLSFPFAETGSRYAAKAAFRLLSLGWQVCTTTPGIRRNRQWKRPFKSSRVDFLTHGAGPTCLVKDEI